MIKTTGPVVPEMDKSLDSWISNIQFILRFPVKILTVIGLLVAGTFAETVPRKSIEILDTSIGTLVLFVIPFLFARFLDWATGLLAAVVCLIVFARLQKADPEEGFLNSVSDEESETKLISNPKRWFVERVLGETPVAISSDRVRTYALEDENAHTTSSHGSSSSSNK